MKRTFDLESGVRHRNVITSYRRISSMCNNIITYSKWILLIMGFGLCLHTWHLKGNDANARPFTINFDNDDESGLWAFLLKMLSVIESCVWVGHACCLAFVHM
jgi:hypothetical protein